MTSQRCGVKDLIDFKTSDAFIVFYPCKEPTVAFCFFIEAAVIADSVVTSIRHINHYEPMSYSQEVTLKLTIKGTLNGLKTIINATDLNKLLDTAEGRATLLDKGRFEMREVSHARTMDASPDATFTD